MAELGNSSIELVNCSIESFNRTSEKQTAKVNSLRPVIASFMVALSSLVNGMALGYPATAIPNLNSQPGPFEVNPFQYSWFGSLYFLGAVPGALLSGWAMDRFGRKVTILFATLPYVVGWVMIAGSINIETMYAGRLLTGFCFAIILPIVGVYISEISPPKLRGVLMSFHELALNIGALFMYIIGTFVPWTWTAITCATFLTVMACGLLFMPETPRWLLMTGEKERALKSLQWIHGSHFDSSEEIRDIENSIKETKEMTPWRDYIKPPLLKYFLISQFLFILQELSGINVVRQYAVTIFQAANTNLNANFETIIIGIVLTIGSIIFTVFVEKRERRVFLLLSSMMMSLSLAGMGIYIEIKNSYADFSKTYLFWLPLLTMAGICIGYVLGVGPMPYVVTSEVFPNRSRGRASSMGVATLCFFGFLITKYFVNVSKAIGDAGAFFTCACICLVGFILIFFTVPETKGKKLEFIQNELTSTSSQQ